MNLCRFGGVVFGLTYRPDEISATEISQGRRLTGQVGPAEIALVK